LFGRGGKKGGSAGGRRRGVGACWKYLLKRSGKKEEKKRSFREKQKQDLGGRENTTDQ